MDKKNIIIGFVGMTHLGLVSAICAAEKGFFVYCFDDNKDHIDNLTSMNLDINEPDLKKLLDKNYRNMKFTNNLNDLNDLDIIYVAPDIPTNDQGESNLDTIDEYLEKLLPLDKHQKVTVILSQVPPGFTRNYEKKFSNLFYQVETLIFGDAVNRSLKPERYIIGTNNPNNKLNTKYENFLLSYGCPILKMKYESAELAKISINMFLVSSVTTANLISELCEKIDADFTEIIPTLKLDKRIGEYAYLNPGLGISGGNLERDLETFSRLANINSTDYKVVKSWIDNSKNRKKWPIKILNEKILINHTNLKISIFGLSYKINTHSVKNSPSIELIKKLENCDIEIYDPIINEIKIKNKLYKTINSFDEETIFGDVIIVMNQSKEFYKINDSNKLDLVKYFIDPFKVIDDKKIVTSKKYFTLGKS
jgi:UDPglucose 6-dehydrogenase